jgi:hypothetical protein
MVPKHGVVPWSYLAVVESMMAFPIKTILIHSTSPRKVLFFDFVAQQCFTSRFARPSVSTTP